MQIHRHKQTTSQRACWRFRFRQPLYFVSIYIAFVLDFLLHAFEIFSFSTMFKLNKLLVKLENFWMREQTSVFVPCDKQPIKCRGPGEGNKRLTVFECTTVSKRCQMNFRQLACLLLILRGAHDRSTSTKSIVCPCDLCIERAYRSTTC